MVSRETAELTGAKGTATASWPVLRPAGTRTSA